MLSHQIKKFALYEILKYKLQEDLVKIYLAMRKLEIKILHKSERF